MGRIYDKNTWDEPIYLVEPFDPVMGGEMGIDNIQAKQLANRTFYLRNLLSVGHSEDGQHSLSGADVVDNAGIQESKLSLNFSTQNIQDLISSGIGLNSEINEIINDSAGVNGSLGASVSKAVPLSWSYSDKAFDFEMFVQGLTLVDTAEQPLIETIAGDESIDVADSSLLRVGNTYVICNDDGSDPETFQVAEILTKKRVLATEDMTLSRTSGKVSRTSWHIVDKQAVAINSSVYFTRQIRILKDKEAGKVVVRIKNDGSTATPYYRFTPEDAWMAPAAPKTYTRATGYVDYEYIIPGGLLELKFVVATGYGVESTIIDNLCVLPLESREQAEIVKQPQAVYPVSYSENISLTPMLQGTPYRSLYGLAKLATQFQVATDQEFTNIVFAPTGTTSENTAVPGATLVTNTGYFWRCRYQDVEGVWSDWSVPAPFSTGTALGMVYTPSISSPSAGALNIPVAGQVFTSTAFASSVADTLDKMQWQFSIGSTFSSVFYDTGEVAGSTTFTYPASGSNLNNETTYYCRVRYNGTSLGWSEWSPYIYFTTAA